MKKENSGKKEDDARGGKDKIRNRKRENEE